MHERTEAELTNQFDRLSNALVAQGLSYNFDVTTAGKDRLFRFTAPRDEVTRAVRAIADAMECRPMTGRRVKIVEGRFAGREGVMIATSLTDDDVRYYVIDCDGDELVVVLNGEWK